MHQWWLLEIKFYSETFQHCYDLVWSISFSSASVMDTMWGEIAVTFKFQWNKCKLPIYILNGFILATRCKNARRLSCRAVLPSPVVKLCVVSIYIRSLCRISQLLMILKGNQMFVLINWILEITISALELEKNEIITFSV